MAKNFLVDLNLNKNELQNAVIQNLASDPSNPKKGQEYFNTTTNRFRVYTGSAWDEMGTGGGTVTSVAVENDSDGGLSVSGSPITSSGTIKVGHSNVLSAAQTTSGLYPIKVDKNGHITELGSAVDLTTYAPKASPAFTGTPTAPTASSGDNSMQIATTAFVTGAISGITGAMHFKGTVGTGGTVSDLPTSGVAIGDTYKVSVAGTYASQAAKVGDLFIATATTPTWAYVPSGDETGVTSVGITEGTGISVSGSPITSSGSITVGLVDQLASAQTTSAVYPIKVNKQGQITELGSAVTILKKYTGTITANSSTTSFTITHNLGTRDVVVQVYDATTYEDVIVDVVRTSTSAVTVTFGTAPATGTDYKVVVIA